MSRYFTKLALAGLVLLGGIASAGDNYTETQISRDAGVKYLDPLSKRSDLGAASHGLKLGWAIGSSSLSELSDKKISMTRKGGLLLAALGRVERGQAQRAVITFCDWVFLIKRDLHDLKQQSRGDLRTDVVLYRRWFSRIPVNQWDIKFVGPKFADIAARDPNEIPSHPRIKTVSERGKILDAYYKIRTWNDYIDFATDADKSSAIDQMNSNCVWRTHHGPKNNYQWTGKDELPLLVLTLKKTGREATAAVTPPSH